MGLHMVTQKTWPFLTSGAAFLIGATFQIEYLGSVSDKKSFFGLFEVSHIRIVFAKFG